MIGSVFRKQQCHGFGADAPDYKNQAVYLISDGKDEFIPAFKGSARIPSSQSYKHDSLKDDTDQDMKLGAGGKVFGNPMFVIDSAEDAAMKSSGHLKPFTPEASQPSQSARMRRKSSAMSADAAAAATNTLIQNSSSAQKATPAGFDWDSGCTPRKQSLAEDFPRKQAFAEASTIVAQTVQRVPASPSLRRPMQTVAGWEADLKQLISSCNRVDAVYKTAPANGMVQCYVKRVKNFFGTHCSFQMHLENGDVFLLAARRRKKSKVSSYIISQDLDDLKRGTDNCLAKLKSNFTGTEYQLWGKSADPHVKKGYAKEQLCINFKQMGLASGGSPRTMFTTMPLPETKWQPGGAPDGADSLSNCLEMATKHELPPQLDRKLSLLSTKPPDYDENLKAFSLDFGGRVKEASVKNFQLVHWDHSTDTRSPQLVLQFGKIDDDLYALDFSYPLNIEVAFSIALASIDTKLCYSY